LVSLLAVLLLLLLDMCRSSCETSFPHFVFIQTCPNHLLALAALPKSFCVPSVALPCTGENLQHVSKSWECFPLPALSNGLRGHGDWVPFHLKKKKICWMCTSTTRVHFPASGHDLPSVYREDACSWPACESLQSRY